MKRSLPSVQGFLGCSSTAVSCNPSHQLHNAFADNIVGKAKLQKLIAASPTEFKDLYEKKKPQIDFLGAVYAPDAPDAVKTLFFEKSNQLWTDIANFLQMTLPSYLPEEGFLGGEKPGEDDFHLAAWLSRIVWVSGGDQAEPEGIEVLAKIHPKLTNVHGKIVNYWETSVSRPSWQKVFARS